MSNNNNTSETSTELSFEMKGKTIVVLGWNVAGRDTYIWFDEQRKEKMNISRIVKETFPRHTFFSLYFFLIN